MSLPVLPDATQSEMWSRESTVSYHSGNPKPHPKTDNRAENTPTEKQSCVADGSGAGRAILQKMVKGRNNLQVSRNKTTTSKLINIADTAYHRSYYERPRIALPPLIKRNHISSTWRDGAQEDDSKSAERNVTSLYETTRSDAVFRIHGLEHIRRQ